jgi:vitamin B12 transporter
VLAEGNWAFRRPRHTAFVRAGLTRGRVTADLAGHYTGTRVDSDFASLDPEITSSGGYWLWNASASVSLSRSVSLVGRVDNIGNVDYMEPLGYPAWRRTAHAGLRVRF